jgi:hypothetical protein
MVEMVKMGKKKQAGNKNRKYGRNKVKCALYRSQHLHERNQVRRLRRHSKRYPADLQALHILQSCEDKAKNVGLSID